MKSHVNLNLTTIQKKNYLSNTAYLINSEKINFKYLLGLLNSNVIFWIFKHVSYNLGENSYRFIKQFVKQLPIKFSNEKHETRVNKLVEQQLTTNKKQTTESTNFKKWLKTTFQIDKFSNKLENYYELTFEEFLKELSEKKVKIKNRQTQELLRIEYDRSTKYIEELKSQINTFR